MTLTVEKEPNAYVLIKDGERIGLTAYDLSDDTITFTHTEVDPEKREKGFAETLVRAALDDIRANSTLRVAATCPYVRHFLKEHPDYQDLLTRGSAERAS
ncbi:GNAT family N-acetyltransferase [Leifsonia sp. NPDC058230]|uniref:GNAT family N-acetyltransferase n=1 Tax=Leifsonia sp. NPDC058230 TaxID=3346391 RepID=UPI0036DBEAA8